MQLIHDDVDDFLDLARKFKVHGLDAESDTFEEKNREPIKFMPLTEPKTEYVEEDKAEQIKRAETSHDINNDDAQKNVSSEPDPVNEHEAVKGTQLQGDVDENMSDEDLQTNITQEGETIQLEETLEELEKTETSENVSSTVVKEGLHREEDVEDWGDIESDSDEEETIEDIEMCEETEGNLKESTNDSKDVNETSPNNFGAKENKNFEMDIDSLLKEDEEDSEMSGVEERVTNNSLENQNQQTDLINSLTNSLASFIHGSTIRGESNKDHEETVQSPAIDNHLIKDEPQEQAIEEENVTREIFSLPPGPLNPTVNSTKTKEINQASNPESRNKSEGPKNSVVQKDSSLTNAIEEATQSFKRNLDSTIDQGSLGRRLEIKVKESVKKNGNTRSSKPINNIIKNNKEKIELGTLELGTLEKMVICLSVNCVTMPEPYLVM